jgi:hypothetical protein
MNLYPRKDIHLQALDNCRVILKGDGLAVEIGSIGIQHGSGTSEYWAWATDTVIPMRTHQSQACKGTSGKTSGGQTQTTNYGS